MLETVAEKIKPSILVVEDERVVARDIETWLKMMGYDVLGTTATGEDCLERARQRRPDLVLMDVRLAGALDGIDTAEQLRSNFDVPVVYMTAYTDERTVSRARDTMPHGYVLKPFRSGELRSAIEIALYKHRAETRQRERERWFATTLRAIGDAVIAVDGAGRVTFMNGSAEALTGVAEEQAKGKQATEVFRLIDERTRAPIDDPIRVALRERIPVRLPPNTALSREERELPIDDSVAPILDENGNLLGAVIVFRDVSEDRRREEQVALSARMASLGVLAAGVGHEINNPLTYVLANAAAAAARVATVRSRLDGRRRDEPGRTEIANVLEELEEMLGEIEHGATRIQRIVSDLGVFARPEAGAAPGDVQSALEWALRVSETMLSERAWLVKDLRPVPLVAGGDARLGQVFLNLLVNAAHAIPPGDPKNNSIFVSSECDAQGTVVIRVRDTGVGMPREVVKRIFEPFFTTKQVGSGTGLGLSICHSIVQGLGGEILVESAPGHGSTFTVRLPGVRSAPRSPPPAERGARFRARILLVDDEERLVAAMARMLKPHHDVETETSARAALERLDRDHAFDVVLCDLSMPGMDGIDFYRELVEKKPVFARRVVFISGGASTQRISEFLDSVPSQHILKPFTTAHLNDFIRSFVSARDAGAS